MALDYIDNISVCKDASCGHGTEMFNLVEIIASLKEQNKLTDRLQNTFYYGHKGFNDYVRINFAYKALSLWGDRLNAKNLFATNLSKEQLFDIYLDKNAKNL